MRTLFVALGLLSACSNEVSSCPQFVVPKNLFALTLGSLHNAINNDKGCVAVFVEVSGLQTYYADKECVATLGTEVAFLRADQVDRNAKQVVLYSPPEVDRVKADARSNVPGLQTEIKRSAGDDAEPVAFPLSGGASVIALPARKKEETKPNDYKATAPRQPTKQTAQVDNDNCK